MSSDHYAPLSSFIIRALADKVYDKRKSAASEIARVVKEFNAKNEPQQIEKIISILTDMILEQNSNSRIGALMGLAAVSVGLGIMAINPYINLLVNPTFPTFKDQSPHVRYYATEALYNVSCVAKGAILELFNAIFSILMDLSMDKDPNVRTGSDLLDRALKGIITESPQFNLLEFIPILREKVYVNDAAAQTRVVSWIGLLEEIPDVSLIPFLPDLLDGLFLILASPKTEVKKMTESTLGQFTEAIRKKPENVDFTLNINILITHAQSTDELVQKVALLWILDFIKLSKRKMLPYASGILIAAVPCINNRDPAFSKCKNLAEEICHNLMKLITPEDDIKEGEKESNVPKDEAETNTESQKGLHMESVMEVLLNKFGDAAVPSKTMVLRIIYHLNTKIPYKMQNYIDKLVPSLIRNISDPSDEVVILVIQVLAHIASSQFPVSGGSNSSTDIFAGTADHSMAEADDSDANEHKGSLRAGKYFSNLIRSLLKLFSTDHLILKARGAFIIRHLCVMLSSEEVYDKFAELLLNEENLTFATQMVQILSHILLSAKELFFLRQKLRDLDRMESCDLFIRIYRSWCHSPVAALTLCLLAQKYKHASKLVRAFGGLDVTMDFLIDLDKLIQMIESPIFTFLRLELLSPGRNPALVETLYGILMLLPQTEVFNLLRNRLNCVPPPHLVRISEPAPPRESDNRINFDELLDHFHLTQKRHQIYKEKEIIARLQSAMIIANS